MTTAEEKLTAIREYILHKRAQCGIVALGRAFRPELSCEAVGEFYNLVECQLLATKEGFGAWLELSHQPVLDGAYRYITEGIRR